jgi:hypothetical protein
MERKFWHFIVLGFVILLGYHNYSTQSVIKESVKELPANVAKIIQEDISKKKNNIIINFGKPEKLEDLFLYQHAQSYSATLTLLGVMITLFATIFGLFQYFNLKEKELDFQKLVEQGEKKLLEQNMLTFELLNLTNSVISKLEKPDGLKEVLKKFFDKVIENLKNSINAYCGMGWSYV